MNILVTGAAGFIGSHLVEHLLKLDHDVVGLDNFDDLYDPKVKEDNLRIAGGNPRFELVRGDITGGKPMEDLFAKRKFDIVVHLAAKAGVRPSIADPVGYIRTNVEGTLNLLELSRKSGIRKFIFASSSSVYGDSGTIPFREDEPVEHPVSPYAASKRAGELLCYNHHQMYGIGIYALRFFSVYGPRQRPDMAIHKFTRLILEGKPVPVFGEGKMMRDFTFIDDIIQGLLNSIDRVRGYEIINLGESKTISVMGLLGVIEKCLGKKALVELLPMQAGDVRETFADISKAGKMLDYKPKVGIEEGVRRYLEWYGSGRDASGLPFDGTGNQAVRKDSVRQ